MSEPGVSCSATMSFCIAVLYFCYWTNKWLTDIEKLNRLTSEHQHFHLIRLWHTCTCVISTHRVADWLKLSRYIGIVNHVFNWRRTTGKSITRNVVFRGFLPFLSSLITFNSLILSLCRKASAWFWVIVVNSSAGFGTEPHAAATAISVYLELREWV